MTGYQSKKKAASAKTIDQVNWADHEPDGLVHTAQDKLELVDYKKLAALGWQAIECPFCGSSGAQAFPKPAQEPVAHIPADALEQIRPPQLILNNVPLYSYAGERTVAVYTAPPQRPWVGLTPEELNMIGDSMRTWNSWSITDVYTAIEAKLRDKNT